MVSGSGGLALLTVARREEHVWSHAEIRAVKTFANQLATGIANIRLYQMERERAERLRLLSEFSQTCARMLEVKTLLQAVPALVGHMMRVPQVSIRLREGEVLTTGTSYGYLHPELRNHPVAVDGVIEGVVLGHQPLVISDLSTMDPLPPVLAERMTHEFSRAALFLPLNARGESLGLLSIFDSEAREWSTAEIQYAQTIANTVAISYSNVRLLETLKQERGDIEMTLNSVFSGVFTTDEEGNIETWSRAATEMTGWTADEMRGKNWVEIVRVSGEYPDELVLEAMARQDVLFGIAPRSLLTERGQEIPLAEAAAPLRDADGRIRGAVGAFWDRTRERQEEQARLDFLHEASHELRNSLTVVLAMAGLLRQSDVKGATREKAIQVIGNQVDRIKGFSDRFLRFESEEFDAPLEQQVMDICEVVTAIAEGLRAKYPDHPIQIVGQGVAVNADPRRLNTVTLNLLDNACKYSPPGTTVWVEIKNVEPNLARVGVRNEGSPIPSEEAKHIFTRGHRGSRAGSEQRPGDGIGLWLAQTMLREMGGQICLDEAQTDGVTLYFTLQRTGVEHDERQIPNPDRRRRHPGPRRTRRNP
jgi:PAS domain S-box-containing protein